ncbi:MAG: rRNA maturation RNase YbeY [Candidatus Moraniibacteriota bacterium]
MRYLVEINNKTKVKFSQKNAGAIFQKTLQLFFGGQNFVAKEIQLSVALVEEEEICLLNQQYRQKNKATDVLSFADYENQQSLLLADLREAGRADVSIGELIVCPAYVQKNAQEDGEDFDYAMTYIVAHGILHLLGLAHGRKMFALQKAVAKELNLEK